MHLQKDQIIPTIQDYLFVICWTFEK